MRSSVLSVLALLALAAPAAADCRFTLTFAHGSAGVRLADGLLLRDLARAYPAGPFALSAHADDDGTPAQNARIAEARARAVAARLPRGTVAQALPVADRWDTVPTRGWSSPLNRRVELFVAGCDPARHREARPMDAPGIAFVEGGGVSLTSPRLP